MQITIDIPDGTARCIEEHIASAKSDFNKQCGRAARRCKNRPAPKSMMSARVNSAELK